MSLNHALAYADIGWLVFPVGLNKAPLTTNGKDDATTDANQIRAWWKKWPAAGIGVKTGIESGIVVLDLDNKPEKNGLENINHIIEEHGPLATTLVAKTGSGGLHYYFKYPENGLEIRNTVNLLGQAGIDIRGEGGYVVVPPSSNEAGQYEWISGINTEIADCPQFIITAKSRKISLNGASVSDDPIPEGQRHDVLIAQAGYMRAIGMGSEAILTSLRHTNEQRCHPPMDDHELQVIADSMIAYPPRPNKSNQNELTPEGRRELLRFPRTDTGAAEMLAYIQQGRLRYNHSRGEWLLWSGHHWQADQKGSIVTMMINAARQYGSAATTLEQSQQADAIKYARGLESKARIDAAISICQKLPDIALTSLDLDKDELLLGVENGVVDLRTGLLRAGLPSDNISYSAEVAYDAQASCPRWIQFLEEIFLGNTEVIDFVHRAVGYTLTGKMTEQCMFILIGTGANGKSVFLDTIRTLFGTYSYTTPFSTFIRTNNVNQQTNDLAAMVNRRIVISSETNEGSVLDESRVKSLTAGNDVVTARFLHQEYFIYRPTSKIWLAVNHAPKIRDDSDGFWRRVRRIDFPAKFGAERADKELGTKLLAELPGILNWALQGCLDWQQAGLNPPQSIVQATQQYRTDSDPLADFINEFCDVNVDAYVPVDDIYRAYSTWAKNRELKNYEKLSSERFHGRLSSAYQRDVKERRKVYLGIQLTKQGERLIDEAITIRRITTNVNGVN